MTDEKISYHKLAAHFLQSCYDANGEKYIFFSYLFLSRLAREAKAIGKAVGLKDMDYQNAIVATWFRYAGLSANPFTEQTVNTDLINTYFEQTNYPEADRIIVQQAIDAAAQSGYAETKVQKVISDAIYSQFTFRELPENIILLTAEINRLASTDETELSVSKKYLQLFIKIRYYTDYGLENYSAGKDRNFQLLEKRISKLVQSEKKDAKAEGNFMMSSKETEDLFKLGFRNYNHLISVADSKASLLIQVNSIIISVMLAFLLGRLGKNIILLWPAVLLLSVSMVTIFLSVLASRPQKGFFPAGKKSHNYSRFFFGSFDFIDNSFRHATWESYYDQLTALFTSPKEAMYLEMYKESFNVRKVLAKKFRYLSVAYWVFLGGLLLSIIAFVIAIQTQPMI
jgi:Family of unknown function (DUF5706)